MIRKFGIFALTLVCLTMISASSFAADLVRVYHRATFDNQLSHEERNAFIDETFDELMVKGIEGAIIERGQYGLFVLEGDPGAVSDTVGALEEAGELQNNETIFEEAVEQTSGMLVSHTDDDARDIADTEAQEDISRLYITATFADSLSPQERIDFIDKSFDELMVKGIEGAIIGRAEHALFILEGDSEALDAVSNDLTSAAELQNDEVIYGESGITGSGQLVSHTDDDPRAVE